MKVAFIGLGIMGSRMARNLSAAPVDLSVWNRDPAKAQPLKEAGITVAATLEECVKEADVVFTMLSDPSAVLDISHRLVREMKEGATWANATTVDVTTTLEAASRAQSHGVVYVDAPVAGSKAPAEKGELIFLAGGRLEDVALLEPLLDHMGKKTVHAGPVGQGTAFKLVVNMMLAANMAVMSEALTLAEGLGLEKEQVLDTIIGGPVAAPVLGLKKDKLKKMDFEVEFPLEWMRKDLHLAAEEGYRLNLPLPTANAMKELYAMADAAGMGRQDFSAVYGFLKGLNRGD